MTRPKNKKKDPLDLVLKKKPYTLTIRLVMDSELTERADQIDRELNQLDRNIRLWSATKQHAERLEKATTESVALLEELEQLEEAIDDVTVDFVFRAIPRAVYTKLLKEHKPTEEQKAEAAEEAEKAGRPKADGELNVNPDTFPPTLVAKALSSPKLTEEQVFAMWDPESEQWNTTELTVLYQAAEKAVQAISLPR